MTHATPKISATIITRNEEANIAACIKSLNWVDEIIVLDSGSTDKTVDVARQYTDKIFVETWRGQGFQKNRAVELAQGPWIISVDADERVSPELAVEIRQAIEHDPSAAFAMRRKNFYQGKWVRHCGWWPDWVKRVFRKGTARFSEDIIHDSLQARTPVKKLNHPIEHHSFHSPEDFLNRAYWYAHHQAHEMHCNGRSASVWTAFSHAGFTLLQTYILRLGFLDGAAGLLVAVSNGVGVFYRYMILRDLNLKDSDAGRPHTER
jgi:glycosyltransferase involved in cell wall biosynthesis